MAGMRGPRCSPRRPARARARRWRPPRGAGRWRGRGASFGAGASSAEPPDSIVKDRQAPAETVDRDPLVDAVPALEIGLLGRLPERREAEHGYAQTEKVLRVGPER